MMLDILGALRSKNYMQHLKRKVRRGNNPAVQLVKRVEEELLNETVYKNVQKETKIHTQEPNNAYKSDIPGKLCEVVYADSAKTYMCRVYHTKEPYSIDPCDSRLLGISKFNSLNYEMKSMNGETLSTRCMMTKLERQVVFLTLLHGTGIFLCFNMPFWLELKLL